MTSLRRCWPVGGLAQAESAICSDSGKYHAAGGLGPATGALGGLASEPMVNEWRTRLQCAGLAAATHRSPHSINAMRTCVRSRPFWVRMYLWWLWGWETRCISIRSASTNDSSRLAKTVGVIFKLCWKSEKRVVPRNSASRMMSRLQRSPTTSSARAAEQFSPSYVRPNNNSPPIEGRSWPLPECRRGRSTYSRRSWGVRSSGS
jgi:hypothetical protein